MPTLLSPTIQLVPISDLVVPDWNPRKVIFEKPLQDLMAYLKTGGRVERILVWKGNGQATQGPYAIISGQRRWEAFKRLGQTQVEVEIMDITLEEAKFLAVGSNEGEEVFWLDWDIRVQQLYDEGNQGGQKLSQAELGAKMGVSQNTVSYALKVAEALTPASREQIYHRVIKLGDPEAVPEKPIRALTALKTPQEVEKALPRVLEGGMSEAQVRAMVAQLQGKPVPAPKPAKHLSPAPQGGGQALVVPSQGAEASEGPRQGSAVQAPAEEGKSDLQKVYDHLKANPAVVGGLGGVLGGFLASNLKRAIGTLFRRYILHALAALGILAVVGYHGIGNFFGSKPKAPVTTANPAPQPATNPVPAPITKPAPPAGEGRVRAKKEAGYKPSSVIVPTASNALTGIPAWSAEALPLVKEVGERFYNRSYQTWDDDQAYLRPRLTEDYAPAFFQQYYPPAGKAELLEKMQVQTFSNGQSPVVVGGQGNTALYRVQGQAILQSRQGRSPQNLGTKVVALEIAVRHVEGMGYRVEKVTPLPTGPQAGGYDVGVPSRGADGKGGANAGSADVKPEASQKGTDSTENQTQTSGVDLKDAVNKANDVVQTGDAARKLLGL